MSEAIQDLFSSAQEEGTLSQEAASALAIPNIGQMIQDGLGISVADVDATEVVLVTNVTDDSGSIRFSGNTDTLIDGVNLILDSLAGSKQKADILYSCRFLNKGIFCPFVSLEEAVANYRLNRNNFQGMGGTPLFDQAAISLGTVLAKTQEFSNNGVPARSVTLLVTDGDDTTSQNYPRARDVEPIIKDMLRQETHIIAAMGIDDGRTDFKQIFSEMGIPENWILTPGNSQSEIRQSFQVFSQSAVQASQTAASFSKTALGGFGG